MRNPKKKYDGAGAYAVIFIMISATTLFGEAVKKYLEPTNIVMFYLFIVVFAAIRWGRLHAIAASILSVLAFDFFLVPPYLTLGVSDIQYIFTFAAFLVVGTVIGTYASKVRERVIERQRELLYSAVLNSISHDLKTPLVSITGALTTLLDPKSAAEAERKTELLKIAAKESERLNAFVNNLLDMARMESGVLRISKDKHDIRDLIGACLEQLKEKAGARDIKLYIPKGLREAAIDYPFLLKALFNIIDNALKYSPEGSPLEIIVSEAAGWISIAVQDHGQGILPNDINRIFEKFYRGRTPHGISGTGLGLCIAKWIVEAHGGRIEIASTISQGSVFTIKLPME